VVHGCFRQQGMQLPSPQPGTGLCLLLQENWREQTQRCPCAVGETCALEVVLMLAECVTLHCIKSEKCIMKDSLVSFSLLFFFHFFYVYKKQKLLSSKCHLQTPFKYPYQLKFSICNQANTLCYRIHRALLQLFASQC